MNPTAYNLTKAAYSLNETTTITSLGKTSIYEAIKAGQLKVTKFGKKTLFTAPDIAAFLDGLRA